MIGIVSGAHELVATYLFNLGIDLTASEINQDNDVAKKWIDRGVLYKDGHNSQYISDELDLVILPNGPIPGNPEYEKAKELGLKVAKLPQILGLITSNFQTIAVAGTHGKTTTTALIIWMLYKEYRELPNFLIGGNIQGIEKEFNFNANSRYFVIEACEYKRQFLGRAPKPYITAITNVDFDHTDYYKDQEDYNSAFKEFISNTQFATVIDSRGTNIKDIVKDLDVRVIDCKDIESLYKDVTAGLVGKHNEENVLRACGVANALGIFPDIEDYPGVKSRFEYIGKTTHGSKVFLDYAHNPKKIRACLQGTKEQFPDKKIVLIWQPHSFERCISFKEDFSKSLNGADVVMIPNIYAPIREPKKYREKLSDEEFVHYLKEKNKEKDIRYTKSFDHTAEQLEEFGKDDILIFASAGDLKDIFKLMEIENE
jgi:UDP-N-acetylmuramate--alanine ligase